MKCIPCLQGMPEFCMTGGNCDSTLLDSDSSQENRTYDDNSIEEDYKRGPKRRRKKVSTLKDPHSTGRKEAARLYPLNKEADCEWANLEKAGGGKFPIKGCALRPVGVQKQTNRHHGPDKNTMNNEKGNVHRICSHCHNLWHAKNDADYDPDQMNED